MNNPRRTWQRIKTLGAPIYHSDRGELICYGGTMSTPEGLYVWSRDDMAPPFIPNAVLQAVLKIGRWKMTPHVMQEI